MKTKLMKLAAALATFSLLACATPQGGTHLVGTEGQTLGGYVATGAIDPDNADLDGTGDDDVTPTGSPANGAKKEPPPPPPQR